MRGPLGRPGGSELSPYKVARAMAGTSRTDGMEEGVAEFSAEGHGPVVSQ